MSTPTVEELEEWMERYKNVEDNLTLVLRQYDEIDAQLVEERAARGRVLEELTRLRDADAKNAKIWALSNEIRLFHEVRTTALTQAINILVRGGK